MARGSWVAISAATASGSTGSDSSVGTASATLRAAVLVLGGKKEKQLSAPTTRDLDELGELAILPPRKTETIKERLKTLVSANKAKTSPKAGGGHSYSLSLHAVVAPRALQLLNSGATKQGSAVRK